MNMLCGNTAALRMYEAEQDRLEKQAPTPLELERYVESWKEDRLKTMGSQFITEAFVESNSYSEIHRAYQDGDHTETGRALFKMVDNYWRPFAIEASRYVNFAEGRYD